MEAESVSGFGVWSTPSVVIITFTLHYVLWFYIFRVEANTRLKIDT